MLRVKYSKFFISAAILYAILIFYLSVTSKIGDLKHLLNITLGHGVRELLIATNLSFVLHFLVHSLHFVQDQSIDPGHVGVYFGFGILLYFVFKSSKNQLLEKYSAICAVGIGSAYGILNEIFQMYLPYRTPSIADAFSNLLGLVISQLLLVLFIFLLRNFQNQGKTLS
jgi:VanZ family protein